MQRRINLKRSQLKLEIRLDSMVYSTEKSLTEHGDKLDPKDKENIEKSIEELKQVLKNENANGSEIKAKVRFIKYSHETRRNHISRNLKTISPQLQIKKMQIRKMLERRKQKMIM